MLVRVDNESDRVNLNKASAALPWALIMDVGGETAAAADLAIAIADWRTDTPDTRPQAAEAPQYRAAGLTDGSPGTLFESIDELENALGMTPELFARLAACRT